MEIVTVRFQDDVLKKMDEHIRRHNFNSRTEFLREAVRDKIEGLTKEEAIAKFMSYYGKAGIATTDKQREHTRIRVGELLEKELAERFKK